MTRLSDAELAETLAFADMYVEIMQESGLRYYLSAEREELIMRTLRQLRDDLDAVTKERDFAIRGDVSLDLTFDDDWDCRVRGPWDLKLLNYSYTIYTGDTPLDALRKALAAHAPTPEGSK